MSIWLTYRNCSELGLLTARLHNIDLAHRTPRVGLA